MKRFLVTHDYGMGSLWWWIEAPSAEAIIQTYAEVMIVEPADGETERFADIPSLRIGDPAPAGLDDLEEQRRVQRASPKFGALVGRGSVYIRKDYPEEQEIYFFEYDEQGIARGRLLCRRVARRNVAGRRIGFSIRRRICGIRSWRSVRLRGRSLRGGGEIAGLNILLPSVRRDELLAQSVASNQRGIPARREDQPVVGSQQ